MSGWGSYFSGRRWSPFGGPPPPATPEIRESDYSYIGQDEIVEPASSYRGADDYYGAQYVRRGNPNEDDPNAPDVLIVKHKDRVFSLPFAAYSISEGMLRIGEVRRAAAERLGVREHRRVRLLYKHRELKDDAAAAGEENLKQNSELTCIVSEAADDLSSDEESPSETEMRRDRLDVQSSERRPDGGSKTRRNRRKKNRRDGKSPVTSPPLDSRGDYFQETSRERPSSRLDPGRSHSATPRHQETSTSPAPPATSSNAFDDSLPSAGPEPPAFKEIADLDRKFRTELVPPSEELLSNPPSDAKKRDYEVIRLTETIERDVVLKLDAIDTQGRQDIRQKRKNLVNSANEMLQKLDSAKKRWKGQA